MYVIRSKHFGLINQFITEAKALSILVTMKFKIMNAIMMIVCILGSIINGHSQNNSDCINPSPICEKKSYHYSNLSGTGDIQDKVDGYKCTHSDFKEVNSKWLKLRIITTF